MAYNTTMGVVESVQAYQKIHEEIESADDICGMLSLLESLPDGYPSFPITEIFVEYIQRLPRFTGRTQVEFLLNYFFPSKTLEDVGFRSAGDPQLLNILHYARDYRLPVTVSIPMGKGFHCTGSRFQNPDFWEIVNGLDSVTDTFNFKTGKWSRQTDISFLYFFHLPQSYLTLWPSTDFLVTRR